MALFLTRRRTGKKTEIKTLYLELPSGKFPVEVIRSNRKSLGLQIRNDGSIVARIPYWVSDTEVRIFLNEHKDWIIRKSASMRNGSDRLQSVGAPPLQDLCASDRRKVREKITGRVSYYCSRMGVSVGQIAVRAQKTKWGSCSAKGNVNFNYLLAYLPDELLDYVVVHELAHRRHMNHSKEFWAEVGKYCPDYKNCRKRLKEYRIS